MEELKQGSNFHIGASESREKHLRLRGKQLICGSLNGRRVRQSLLQPYIFWTGMRSPGRCSGWELEFRDCGAIPGRGLLLSTERDQGDVREEIVVGNACGAKPGRHRSKAILLSHAQGVEPSP